MLDWSPSAVTHTHTHGLSLTIEPEGCWDTFQPQTTHAQSAQVDNVANAVFEQ